MEELDLADLKSEDDLVKVLKECYHREQYYVSWNKV